MLTTTIPTVLLSLTLTITGTLASLHSAPKLSRTGGTRLRVRQSSDSNPSIASTDIDDGCDAAYPIGCDDWCLTSNEVCCDAGDGSYCYTGETCIAGTPDYICVEVVDGATSTVSDAPAATATRAHT